MNQFETPNSHSLPARDFFWSIYLFRKKTQTLPVFAIIFNFTSLELVLLLNWPCWKPVIQIMCSFYYFLSKITMGLFHFLISHQSRNIECFEENMIFQIGDGMKAIPILYAFKHICIIFTSSHGLINSQISPSSVSTDGTFAKFI